jgi:hypothetical protein
MTEDKLPICDLLPAIPLSIEQIDPDNRNVKLCRSKGKTHSYMADTGPA